MTEEELHKFGERLSQSMTFPSVYMFKFIIASEHRNIALIQSLFDAGTDIHTLESRQGKYTSITAKLVVMTVTEILDIYRKAAKIEGVMFL